MALSYELYVRHEVYQNLRNVRGSNRQRILSFMESLINDPFREGDHTERDRAGRQYQIKIIGRFALYYWSDHAEKEVRIVDLIDADLIG